MGVIDVNRSAESTFLTGVLVFALLIVHAPTVTAQTTGPVNGNAIKGETLYYDHLCYACHGYDGQGRRPLIGSGMISSETGFIRFQHRVH